MNLLSNISNKNKMNLSLYTIDLKTGKVVANNEQYSIKKLNEIMDVSTFRIIDNKIYILLNAFNPESNMNSSLNIKEYTDNVIVLDQTSKSTLYIGEYRQGNEFTSSSYILKNDEL